MDISPSHNNLLCKLALVIVGFLGDDYLQSTIPMYPHSISSYQDDARMTSISSCLCLMPIDIHLIDILYDTTLCYVILCYAIYNFTRRQMDGCNWRWQQDWLIHVCLENAAISTRTTSFWSLLAYSLQEVIKRTHIFTLWQPPTHYLSLSLRMEEVMNMTMNHFKLL